MASLSDLLETFPARLAIISAALAGISGLLFPTILIPDNRSNVGSFGVLVTLVIFLIAWAFAKEMHRWRKPTFLIASVLCLIALGVMVRVHLKAVVPIDEIGHPPRSARYLIGTQLTPEGIEWDRMLGHPSKSSFIKSIGPSNIPKAWGKSYERNDVQYTVAYLIFTGGVVLMLAVSENPRRAKR